MKLKIIFTIFGILLYTGGLASADYYIYIDDGQNHLISDATYQSNVVNLDYYVTNTPGTHFQIVEGANIWAVQAYNNSTVAVDGGLINIGINADKNSQIQINGGTIDSISSYDQSSVNINGGTIRSIASSGDSTVEIRGGTFSGQFMAAGNGTIYLYGENFSTSGVELKYGDNLRDYGVIGGPNYAFLTGAISGTLSDGSLLNNEFLIRPDGGNIIIIPEPATLCLLALGGLILRRNSRK